MARCFTDEILLTAGKYSATQLSGSTTHECARDPENETGSRAKAKDVTAQWRALPRSVTGSPVTSVPALLQATRQSTALDAVSTSVNIAVVFRTNSIADLGPTSGLLVCSAVRRGIPSNKTTERGMKIYGFSRSDYVIRSDRSPCSNRVDISGSDLSGQRERLCAAPRRALAKRENNALHGREHRSRSDALDGDPFRRSRSDQNHGALCRTLISVVPSQVITFSSPALAGIHYTA